MKSLKIALAVSAIVAAPAFAAPGAGEGTATGTVSADIVRPISLTAPAPIDFGLVVNDIAHSAGAAGTVSASELNQVDLTIADTCGTDVNAALDQPSVTVAAGALDAPFGVTVTIDAGAVERDLACDYTVTANYFSL